VQDRSDALYIVTFEGCIAGRERFPKRFVIPGEESIGRRVDIEPGESGRFMRRRFDAAYDAAEIDTRRMRTKTPANPITNMGHRFDFEPRFLANFADDGLLR